MRLASLPPVRRAVPLRRGEPAAARAALEAFFGNRPVTLYGSGTAALAAALAQCVAGRASRRPEVILPAYGCPDLVAACLQAAAQPRLVDIAASGWGYDEAGLQAALSPDTVAVVAVNLLGVGDGAVELAAICAQRRIPLVQDSAQHLPREPTQWPGDYVVLSFGRGKPLNLLRGGALISPAGRSVPGDLPVRRAAAHDRLLSSRAAAIAFNLLTRPHLYRLLSAVPGTGLGAVAYEPLHEAAPLPEQAWARLGPAFAEYRRRCSYSRNLWDSTLSEWVEQGLLPLRCPDNPLPDEPLRLALLAPDRALRDALLSRMQRAGLGATAFYGCELPQVRGIPEAVRRQGPFPNARALAERLLTLPTHGLVTAAHIARARAEMRAVA